jgi:hypothetical protein
MSSGLGRGSGLESDVTDAAYDVIGGERLGAIAGKSRGAMT